MVGIWICKCIAFMQDKLSLDLVVEICGLHVNSLSRKMLFPDVLAPVIWEKTDPDTRNGLPDMVGDSWLSRSPPRCRGCSAFPSLITLKQGS